MNRNAFQTLATSIQKHLLWFGIINLIVGFKLIVSFVWPGLRTPGELILSGGILLIYSVKIWSLRGEVKEFIDASK